MTDHLALLRTAAATAEGMAPRMEHGARGRDIANAYAAGLRHAETIAQDAHDAHDPEATELRDGWHRLANHPAIRPPHWEPGNGQSYLEAVLEHLDTRTAQAVPAEDGAAQDLPTEDGAVIVPAEGHEHITRTVRGVTYHAREAMLSGGRWHAVWRTATGGWVCYSVRPEEIDPGPWQVDDQ